MFIILFVSTGRMILTINFVHDVSLSHDLAK